MIARRPGPSDITAFTSSRRASEIAGYTGDPEQNERSPDAVVVGIVGREVLSCCSTTGPGSDVCSQMPFFASHDAAERWLGVHPGVAIVDLDTARPIAAAFAATFP